MNSRDEWRWFAGSALVILGWLSLGGFAWLLAAGVHFRWPYALVFSLLMIMDGQAKMLPPTGRGKP